MTAAFALTDTLPGISTDTLRSARADTAPGISATPSLARLVGAGKIYGAGETAIAALEGATLDIRAGEVTLIEGPSGSGKTTLISILGLLLRPTSGEVWLEGRNVAHLTERDLPPLRARNFGFVFQGFNLFPALTALENVAMAIQMKNPRAKSPRDEARRLLELVGLESRSHHLPADLSGGQKQRVAIARALGGNPPIIVGDEPTAALDTKARELARSRRCRRHSRSSSRALRRSRRARRRRPHFQHRSRLGDPMSKLRTSLLVALPLAVAGGLWFGRGTQSASAAQPALARPAVLVAPARVEATRDPVALAFEAGGRIVAIEVDEGNAVRAGQVIARLDDRMAKARVAAADAAVAGAQASYLMSRRGPRGEDLAAARAELDAAKAAAAHRDAEQVRSEKLGAVGAVASASVDADSAAARVADANAAAAAARYQALVKGSRSEQIAAAAATLDAAKAELEAAKISLDQTVLRAPHDGVVLRRFAEVGALVTTVNPTPIVSIADLGQLQVRAEIDEADLSGVAVGKTAYATADAYGTARFPIRLTRVSRELGRKTVRDDDPRARVDTRVLEVVAQFTGTPGESLPLGLRMYVHLER